MWRSARSAMSIATTLIALASPAAAQRADLPRSDLQGTIQLVDMRVPELVIHTESATRRVRLGPMTVIVIAGMPATASELRPGQRVAVQLHVTGGGVVRDLAARIVVLR